MSHYLLRRAGLGLLVLWAAFTLSFVLLQVLPGDAVLIKFQNPDLGLSPAQIEEMRIAYGADSPLWQQYLHTLGAMLHGDFGFSVQADVAVSELIATNLPDTLSLALPAFALAVVLAFTLALASRLPGLRWLSNAIQSLPVLFISLPTFWLGIALIQLFSFQLRLIPVINPSPLQGLILAARYRQCPAAGAEHRRAAAGRTDCRGADHRDRVWPQWAGVAHSAGSE